MEDGLRGKLEKKEENSETSAWDFESNKNKYKTSKQSQDHYYWHCINIRWKATAVGLQCSKKYNLFVPF
jgi:hypothetical protein